MQSQFVTLNCANMPFCTNDGIFFFGCSFFCVSFFTFIRNSCACRGIPEPKPSRSLHSCCQTGFCFFCWFRKAALKMHKLSSPSYPIVCANLIIISVPLERLQSSVHPSLCVWVSGIHVYVCVHTCTYVCTLTGSSFLYPA